MAKTMEHLSDFVFVSMANLTLTRRDCYLSHLKSGIKPDTLAALRTAPLQLATLLLSSGRRRILQGIRARDSQADHTGRVVITLMGILKGIPQEI